MQGHAVGMSKELTNFAAQMRAARKAKALSQEELAALADVSAETISNLERAKFAPTFEVVTAIIRVLDLDPTHIFHRDKSDRRASARRLEQETTLLLLAQRLDDRSIALLLDIAAVVRKAAGR